VTFEALPDDELTDRWEASTLGGSGIGDLDHVRIAWVLARRHGREQAEKRLVGGTRRNSAFYGVPERFDEALRRKWAIAVADAFESDPRSSRHRSPPRRHPEEAQAILAALALLSTDRKRNATFALAELLGRRGSEWPCETPITWAREA
jgi:hypothetical protein